MKYPSPASPLRGSAPSPARGEGKKAFAAMTTVSSVILKHWLAFFDEGFGGFLVIGGLAGA
jgi:hypothetical protein